MTSKSPTEDDLQEVLNVLNSPTSRVILNAVADEPMSATEISDTYDIPRSTVYRKLDALCEVSLLERISRLRPDGHHENVYRRDGHVLGIVANETGVELRTFSSDGGSEQTELAAETTANSSDDPTVNE